MSHTWENYDSNVLLLFPKVNITREDENGSKLASVEETGTNK